MVLFGYVQFDVLSQRQFSVRCRQERFILEFGNRFEIIDRESHSKAAIFAAISA
jgi:hypothetical protein